jgi:hypothetical protein
MRVPILTALLVMGLFGCASYMVNRAETALQSAQMEQAAQRIDARIDAQVSLLYSVRAFFMNSDEVTRKELQGFLSAAEISKRAPGMQGVDYCRQDMDLIVSRGRKPISQSDSRSCFLSPMTNATAPHSATICTATLFGDRRWIWQSKPVNPPQQRR